MRFTLLTLFPDFVESYFRTSVMAKAVERGLVSYSVVNIRDFAVDRHRTCDDAPYGGGYGMVLKAEPLAAALDSVGASDKHVVYTTPAGVSFDQERALGLAEQSDIVLICGRYEGIDERIIDLYVDEQLSVGDYVLSSGELASLAVVDAVFRLVDGVITAGSLNEESHCDSLLEYPHYTRPEVFRGRAVPEVLLSGNHAAIDAWRRRMSVERTAARRPDLLARAALSDSERERLIENGGHDESDTGD